MSAEPYEAPLLRSLKSQWMLPLVSANTDKGALFHSRGPDAGALPFNGILSLIGVNTPSLQTKCNCLGVALWTCIPPVSSANALRLVNPRPKAAIAAIDVVFIFSSLWLLSLCDADITALKGANTI